MLGVMRARYEIHSESYINNEQAIRYRRHWKKRKKDGEGEMNGDGSH
jgi:hypothetical protein